jgi:hypothetical protein
LGVDIVFVSVLNSGVGRGFLVVHLVVHGEVVVEFVGDMHDVVAQVLLELVGG